MPQFPGNNPAEPVEHTERYEYRIMKLTFDKGTILARGDLRVPNFTWDERSKTFRAVALYYRDIIDFLKRSGFDFSDNVLNLLSCPLSS